MKYLELLPVSISHQGRIALPACLASPLGRPVKVLWCVQLKIGCSSVQAQHVKAMIPFFYNFTAVCCSHACRGDGAVPCRSSPGRHDGRHIRIVPTASRQPVPPGRLRRQPVRIPRIQHDLSYVVDADQRGHHPVQSQPPAGVRGHAPAKRPEVVPEQGRIQALFCQP